MLILLFFSFFAGIVTILSPCILPILPIVLSGSLGGGRRRPIGIVIGFITSFTFFTLFLATIVRILGIPADVLRYAAIVTIGLFGLSLLIPRVQTVLEHLFTGLSSSVSSKSTNRSGLRGGFLLGLSLGLIWTPCVGPILASVISLALSGSVNSTAFLITLAYSIGTAIPMLAITYGGRSLLKKVPWLISNTGTIQKIFGVVMIATAIGMFFNADRKFQTYILAKFPRYGVGLTALEDTAIVRQEIEKLQQKPEQSREDLGKPMDEVLNKNLVRAPELIAGGQWFNSSPLTMQGLRGKVVLIDFWTYTCINCIRTLPYLKTWHEKYADDGLVIIGVHTPEFEFEKNPNNVAQAIKDFALPYPVMQDNDYRTWRAYNNRYWPAKYIINKDGKIVYTHFGEGAYDETEKKIQELLSEGGISVTEQIDNPTYQIAARTPELYLGYQRIEYLASPERVVADQPSSYSAPATIPPNHFAFSGTWTVGNEYSMPARGASLSLQFEAREVFLVMRSKNSSETGTVTSQLPSVRVRLDGSIISHSFAGADVGYGVVGVSTDRLYKLIRLPSPGKHELTLEFPDGNIEVYAFTFG